MSYLTHRSQFHRDIIQEVDIHLINLNKMTSGKDAIHLIVTAGRISLIK